MGKPGASTSRGGEGATDRPPPPTAPDSREGGVPRSSQLSPGRLIDEKFRLKKLLGLGGMAEVLLAQDVTLGRDVALKFLGSNLLVDPTWRARFTVEAQNMARVRHPNVVQVYSFGVHDGWPYFVMEYVRGTSLADRLRAYPLPPPEEIADIVRQVSAGLDAIHAAGLVHHDVKPANILLGDDGRVVLADLGLARLVSSRAGGAAIAGTPRYMAPEQLALMPLGPELAPRTDVYQLGVTTYEMLTGRVPFDAAEPLVVLEKHRAQIPKPPSSERGGLNPTIDRVVATALAKDPSLRYSTASAFAEALAEAIDPNRGWRRISNRPARPLRILVADDDPYQLRATLALLELELPAGTVVEGVPDGLAALSRITLEPFDVLVLDLHMPGRSGLEVAAALPTIKLPGRRPRMVLVTAEGGSQEWRAFRAVGGDALLLKPIDAEQLLQTVERLATQT